MAQINCRSHLNAHYYQRSKSAIKPRIRSYRSLGAVMLFLTSEKSQLLQLIVPEKS